MRSIPNSWFLNVCACGIATLLARALGQASAAELRIEAVATGASEVRVSWEWLPAAPPSWRLWRVEPGAKPSLLVDSGTGRFAFDPGRGEVAVPFGPGLIHSGYLMDWVEADGGVRVHGPFRPAGWDFHPLVSAAGPETVLRRQPLPAGNPVTAGGPPEPRVLVSLVVSKPGVYRVPAEVISGALGLPSGTVRDWFSARSISLAVAGVRMPVWFGPDGSNAWVHVPPVESPYFDGDVLQLGGVAGPPLAERAAEPTSGLPRRIGLATMAMEQNLVALPNAPGTVDSDIWMWEILAAGHPVFGRRTYPIVPPALPTPAGAGKLLVELLSTSESHHLVEIQFNGTTVAMEGWEGRDVRRIAVDLPAGLLAAGTNRLSLTNRGDRTSTVYVNRFSLGHPRSLTAADGFLAFEALGDGPVAVGGFALNRVEAWDTSDPMTPVRLTGLATTAAGDGWQVAFQAGMGKRYAVFEPDHVPAVVQAHAVAPMLLSAPTNVVDYLAVVPSREWLTALQPLLQLREGQGLRVRAVTLEVVRDEFAAGRPLPSALHELARAARNWSAPPLYILLVGDGTYDYRGYTGFADNLMPPMQAMTALGRFPSDIGMADTDGDGVWETAVGRLPVRTPGDLATWIDKLEAYEARPVAGRSRSLLLADFPDAAGQFITDSELLRASLEPAFDVETLYNTANSVEAVRSGISAALGREPAVWNYAGHGARDRLGNGYVVAADVPSLPSTQVPPWLVAMTCGAGHFGIPGFDAIAEQLLLRTNGGSIAVWSPSGFSQNASARLLNQSFVDALVAAPPRPRLGDVVRAALRGYAKLGGDPQLPLLYNVLGDPATRLRLGSGIVPGPVELFIDFPDGSELTLRWIGGVPPFRLERTQRIEGAEWVEVLETSDSSARIPRPAMDTFYRVRSSQ